MNSLKLNSGGCRFKITFQYSQVNNHDLKKRQQNHDEGFNAEITYSLVCVANKAQQVFSLNSNSGIITIPQPLNFEEVVRCIMDTEAKDRGFFSTRCKV